MKTSIFNGSNFGKLEFNYSVTFRPRHNVYIQGMQKQIEYLFKDVNYVYLCYSWENDRYSKVKHSHSLVNTKISENILINKIKQNLESNGEPSKIEREIIYTEPRKLLNPKTGEKITTFAKKKINVVSTEISGKHGSVFVEKIVSNLSSSLYCMKFTDTGANFGYLQR